MQIVNGHKLVKVRFNEDEVDFLKDRKKNIFYCFQCKNCLYKIYVANNNFYKLNKKYRDVVNHVRQIDHEYKNDLAQDIANTLDALYDSWSYYSFNGVEHCYKNIKLLKCNELLIKEII